MDGRQLLAGFIERETSQVKFARDCECSESHLSLYLKGERELSLPLAGKMSRISGVPLKALVSEEVRSVLDAAE